MEIIFTDQRGVAMKKIVALCLGMSCILVPAEKRVTIVEPNTALKKAERPVTPPYNPAEAALKKLQDKAALDAQMRWQSGSGFGGR
jgi:hypothetical protein